MTDLQNILKKHQAWIRGEPEGKHANLRGANLQRANLQDADLRNTKTNYLTAGLASACPAEGGFIAWKHAGDYTVKLKIPAEAARSSATTVKCRAQCAKVLRIEKPNGTKACVSECDSSKGERYIIEETIHADGWTEDRWVECGQGIHFFMNREHAVAWGE